MPSGVSLAQYIRRLEKIERRKPREELFPDVDIELRGANLELHKRTDPQILLVGAAGTGKTTSCLKRIYDLCMEHKGIRVAMVRKTRASLTETTLATWEHHILGHGHPLLSGSNRRNREHYKFPNGSQINIVGMDKPERVLSADYDLIYVCQAEQINEEDAEALISRLRNNRMPFQQLMMDCNPHAESHWLYQWYKAGKLPMLTSHHKDNPAFYDIDKDEWTKAGEDYVLGKLANLSGVQYKRWYLGQWCTAEGAVYEFERSRHITSEVLPAMRRYICGVDWGHKDAGSMIVVGEGIDDKLYVVEEHIRTFQTLDFWKRLAHDMIRKYRDIQFFCDPSVQQHIHAFAVAGIPAFKAMNNIKFGIDVVQQRLATNRLLVHTGSVRNTDSNLREAHEPVTLVEEFEQYVWNEAKDAPKDSGNHGLDALRYAVCQIDRPMYSTTPVTSAVVTPAAFGGVGGGNGYRRPTAKQLRQMPRKWRNVAR